MCSRGGYRPQKKKGLRARGEYGKKLEEAKQLIAETMETGIENFI